MNVNTAISHQEQDPQTQVDQTRVRISELESELSRVELQWEDLAQQREQYQLLGEVCDSLDRLAGLEAAPLFWGDREDTGAEHLGRVRARIAGFEQRITDTQTKIEKLQHRIREQQDLLGYLYEEIREAQIQEERKKDEFLVEREINPLPYRMTVMPWARNGEDDKRFRKSVLIAFLISIGFAYLIPLWEIPIRETNEPVEIPERLARLVKKQTPPPPPEQPRPAEEKPEESAQEKPREEQPVVAEKTEAREKAERSGVLAFKDSFSDLIDNAPDAKLGAKARVRDDGKTAGETERSIVAQEAQSTSGGIDSAALSRNVGGEAGEQIDGVEFARVASAIGTDMEAGGDRPLSDGPGPSRTDEEIQIVFDRYKATLYRIYNRELRQDPTLQGKMVLRITIEADGSVSACSVESSDLDSALLSAEIVDRVQRFNFGPKEGVPPTTILYPIDFLPSA